MSNSPLSRRRFITIAAAGAGVAALPVPAAAARPSSVARLDLVAAAAPLGSWGDQRDGTYVNPVLPTDVSDIDAIRVGDDYSPSPRRCSSRPAWRCCTPETWSTGR